jgi:hypothetical protein
MSLLFLVCNMQAAAKLTAVHRELPLMNPARAVPSVRLKLKQAEAHEVR